MAVEASLGGEGDDGWVRGAASPPGLRMGSKETLGGLGKDHMRWTHQPLLPSPVVGRYRHLSTVAAGRINSHLTTYRCLPLSKASTPTAAFP